MKFFIAPNSKNIITTLHVAATEKSELIFLLMGPGRDSGSAVAKNVLDALENDTKANFQENTLTKYGFRKSGGGGCYCIFICCAKPYFLDKYFTRILPKF